MGGWTDGWMDGWKDVTVDGIAAVTAVSSASRFISARVQRPGGGRICRRLGPLKGSVHVQIKSQTPYGATFVMRLAILAFCLQVARKRKQRVKPGTEPITASVLARSDECSWTGLVDEAPRGRQDHATSCAWHVVHRLW